MLKVISIYIFSSMYAAPFGVYSVAKTSVPTGWALRSKKVFLDNPALKCHSTICLSLLSPVEMPRYQASSNEWLWLYANYRPIWTMQF